MELEESLDIADRHPVVEEVKPMPTLKNINDLELIVNELRDMSMKKQVDDVYSSLLLLWNILGIPKKPEELKIEYNKQSLENLRNEKKRCDAIKLVKVKDAIQDVRSDIRQMMDLCKKSKRFIDRSIANAAIEFDETTLRRHEEELANLKTFYEENYRIYKLLDERDIMKKGLIELSKQNDVKARLRNRGGALLKEEQQKKKLIRVEIALSKAVKEYEAKHFSRFMIFDKPVEVDHSIQDRQELKRSLSTSDLKLKGPLKDLGNKH